MHIGTLAEHSTMDFSWVYSFFLSFLFLVCVCVSFLLGGGGEGGGGGGGGGGDKLYINIADVYEQILHQTISRQTSSSI